MAFVLMTNNTLPESLTGDGEKDPPPNRGFRPVSSISTSSPLRDPCRHPSRRSSRTRTRSSLKNETVTITPRCRHTILPVGPVDWWDRVMLQGVRSSPGVAFAERFSSSDRQSCVWGEVNIPGDRLLNVPSYSHHRTYFHSPFAFFLLTPSSFGGWFYKTFGANSMPTIPLPLTTRVFAAKFFYTMYPCLIIIPPLSRPCIPETNTCVAWCEE